MKTQIQIQLPDDLQPKQVFMIHAICYLTMKGWEFCEYSDCKCTKDFEGESMTCDILQAYELEKKLE